MYNDKIVNIYFIGRKYIKYMVSKIERKKINKIRKDYVLLKKIG